MTGVTNAELQSQINRVDEKGDERHAANSKLLGDLATRMDTLIQLNVDQKLLAQLVGQLGERAKAHEESFVEFYRRLAKVESTSDRHSWIWKGVGAVLLASLAGMGWLLAQMKDYYHLEYRVDTLEFLVQGRTTPVLPPPLAQTSSGPK